MDVSPMREQEIHRFKEALVLGSVSLNEKNIEEMGCGASKESVAHSEPQPASNKKQKTTAPLDGECSQLHQNFDCDPEDESASKAAKAVNLIARACSPTVTCEPEQDGEDDCGNKDDKQEQEDDSKAQRAEDESDSGATAAARSSSLPAEPEDEDDDDGDSGLDGNAASSAVSVVVGNELIGAESADVEHAAESDENVESLEGIAESPSARSPNTSQYGRDREQGVDDILPKAAKAALEAIVKSAEDDIQAHKVAAVMAAVGDILFGAKDDAEMKIDKEVAEGRQAAHIRNGEAAHALNGEVETDAFPPSGTTADEDEDCSNNEYSPKSGFLFDYCQKLRLNGYKVSSPPSTSISSEGDTISFIQDFLEEIDLTKELTHDPGTPRILFKDFSPTTPFSFTGLH